MRSKDRKRMGKKNKTLLMQITKSSLSVCVRVLFHFRETVFKWDSV
jgi:hypothetical protein